MCAAVGTNVEAFTRARPSRKPLPAHLPRERVVVPARSSCACCGSDRLSKLGEDVTQTLEVIPRQWKVVQTVRERFACHACEAVTQPPAPFHATPRAVKSELPGDGHVREVRHTSAAQPSARPLCSRRRRPQPLDARGSGRYLCRGAATAPRLIEAHVLAAERLHGDDTTVPVLAKTKTDTGRLWTYVRDDRPFGGPEPPAALFRYPRTRRAEHPVAHLTGYGGILQADAYAGYNTLFRLDRKPSPLTRALCLAHARRKFFELADVASQPRGYGRVRCARHRLHPVHVPPYPALRRDQAVIGRAPVIVRPFVPKGRQQAKQRRGAKRTPLNRSLEKAMCRSVAGSVSVWRRCHVTLLGCPALCPAFVYVLTAAFSFVGSPRAMPLHPACLSDEANVGKRAVRAFGQKTPEMFMLSGGELHP